MNLPVYMDYNATTPVDPTVLAAMLPFFTERFGNAASRSHSFGWAASEAVDRAREQVAALIGATPREIVFTSGATESDNLAVKGVADACRARGNHIITVATEHKAVLDSCKRLEHDGFRVTYLPVGGDGLIDVDDVGRTLTEETILVSVMTANNEIGVIQPIAEIGALARARGVVFHTDAVQAVGKIPFDVNVMNVDLVSLTAHKMYGPKGVGALYVRRRRPELALTPLIDGGGHECGLRSGTLNVAGIVGFGAAANVCRQLLDAESFRLAVLRDRLQEGLQAALEGLIVNGSLRHRLPHTLHVSVAGVEGEALLTAIDDIAISPGAACTSASVEPSYVLKALGIPTDLALASIRFSLGRFSTEEEIAYTIAKVTDVVNRLRHVSPIYELVDEDGGSANGWQLD